MKGSPRSLMLSAANRAMGWWTSLAVASIQRQQRAMAKTMIVKTWKPRAKKRRRK